MPVVYAAMAGVLLFVNTNRGALRWPSGDWTLAAAEPFFRRLAKLPSISEVEVALPTLSRVFCLEEGRSEPIAPQLPLVDVRELGTEHSTSPERLPEPLRPESESLSVIGVSDSSALSETGDMLPVELLVPLRLSWPALTRLWTADRRVRVAKFLLPSCLDVGILERSSNEGGPRGWRIGCSPTRA